MRYYNILKRQVLGADMRTTLAALAALYNSYAISARLAKLPLSELGLFFFYLQMSYMEY